MPQLPNPRVLKLFHPKDTPYRGMFSTPSPIGLGLGELVLGQNIRIDDRHARSRWGLKKAGSSPAQVGAVAGSTAALGTGAYPVGAKAVQANGTIYAM